MTKKSYTPQEAMNLLKVSKATLYAWMNKGKIEYKETTQGRLVILSDEKIVESQEAEQLLANRIDSSKQIRQTDKTVLNSQDNLVRLLNLVESLQRELVEKSELAGQAKLLTDDLLHRKDDINSLRQDCEFYKNKYFEIDTDLKNLKQENQELKSALEEERRKSIWKYKFF